MTICGEFGLAGFEGLILQGINDGRDMLADSNAICQLLAVGNLAKDGGDKPAFQESDDDGTVVLRSQRMGVTKNSAEDAAFLVAF